MNYWIKEESLNLVLVGFTKEFLDKIGPIWNLVPRIPLHSIIKQDSIVFAMETSNCLHSVKSPVSGRLGSFNLEMLEKPDQITDRSWLFQVGI